MVLSLCDQLTGNTKVTQRILILVLGGRKSNFLSMCIFSLSATAFEQKIATVIPSTLLVRYYVKNSRTKKWVLVLILALCSELNKKTQNWTLVCFKLTHLQSSLLTKLLFFTWRPNFTPDGKTNQQTTQQLQRI